MNKKIMPTVLLAVMLSCSAVHATDVSIGTDIPALVGQKCSLRIYNQNTDPASAGIDDIVYFDEAEADKSSKIKFEFDFGMASGYYPYIIKSFAGDWEYAGTLAFVNDKEFENAIKEIKAAVNSSDLGVELKKALDNNENVFLLNNNFDIVSKIKVLNTTEAYKKIAEQIKPLVDSDSLTSEKLSVIYKTELLLCGIEKGNAELIYEIDDKYGDLLNLDTEIANKYYNDFSADQKRKVAEMEKGAYKTAEEYKKEHNTAVAIEAVNNSTSWLSMGKIIDELNTICNLDFPSLSQTDRSTVLTGLTEKKPFASKSAFSSAVNTLVSNLNKEKNHPTISTGGGGGGSTPYANPIATAKPSTDPEEDKEMFADLKDASWAKTAIEYLASKGIVNGKGNKIFAPNDKVTREEFVKIIVGALNIEASDADLDFDDIDVNQWYAPYIKKAVAAGVVKGIDKGIFGIGNNITREDACVMIARAVGLNDTQGEIKSFSDCDEVSDYAINAVAALSDMGIINGSDGKFMPKKAITRAEVAKIIYTYMTREVAEHE